MSFKKDGADPITTRPNVVSMGGLSWVWNAALQRLGFDLDALLGRRQTTFYDGLRYVRSKGPAHRRGDRKLRRNMLLVSRRTRRKHRMARKAA